MVSVAEAEVQFLLDKFDILYGICPVGFTVHPGPIGPMSVVLLEMTSKRDAELIIECNGYGSDYAVRHYVQDDGRHVVAVLL